MVLIRHFTATGYVAWRGFILMHWHNKVQALLPPGGHIDPNEDPVQAVLREVLEETGLAVEVLPSDPPFPLKYPDQIFSPEIILVEDIQDPVTGPHQHIDMIYFCKIIGHKRQLKGGWLWVNREDILNGVNLAVSDSLPTCPPQDVRILAERAFDIIGNDEG